SAARRAPPPRPRRCPPEPPRWGSRVPGASSVDAPARAPAACVPGLAPRTRQLLADYAELTKPKVQSLLLLTTIATMYVAGDPSPLLVGLTCLGGYLSAGGAGAVNHFLDRDIDARMTRTATRPIPAGRISPRAALAFGCLLRCAQSDYARPGVPMLRLIRGEQETRRQILLYAVLLYAVTQLPFCAGRFGAIYLAGSLALGLTFIAGAVRLYRRADRRSALQLYLFSLAYLALLFCAMVADVHL